MPQRKKKPQKVCSNEDNSVELPRLGPEFVLSLYSRGGPMSHRLDRKNKTRDKKRRVEEAIDEY